MLAGSALMVAATLGAWLALVSVGGLSAAAFEVAPAVRVACVLFAGPIAFAAAVRTIASAFRGPQVVAFERGDAVVCSAAEAETIRGAAQLRGTMGGAGHLHPGRFVFPLAAWVAALLCGAEAVSARAIELAGSWPVAIAVFSVIAALLFPSRPYWYRELTGGGVLVTPPASAALLTARAVRDEGAPAAAGPDQGV